MFLKNKNIIFEIRRSKVTDYAALMGLYKLYGIVDSFVCVDYLHPNQHVSVMSGRVFLVQ